MSHVIDSPTSRGRRPRFAKAFSADDLERQAWFRDIERINVQNDVVTSTLEMFELMLQEIDSGVADGCMLITAQTGAGKTHVLNLIHNHEKLSPFVDNHGPIRPLVALQAPSPCTSTRLAKAIYTEMTGETLPVTTKEHEAWEAARAQLFGQMTSVLSIDEAHHMFLKRTPDERRSLMETLKNLVLPEITTGGLNAHGLHPIGLILSGLPTVKRVMQQDGQLMRRSAKVDIAPLTRTKRDTEKLARFIRLVEDRLMFPVASELSSTDMLARFQIASTGYLGRVMAIIKKAARIAIFTGCDRIDRIVHLARVAEQQFDIAPERNPFLVRDLSKCGRMPTWQGDDTTLLRGKQVTADDDQES